MRRGMIAFTILALQCSVFAQSGSLSSTQEQSSAHIQQTIVEPGTSTQPASQTCYYPFTSGSGNTYLYYCITPNANITYLETPHGYAQINHTLPYPPDGGEGYGICDATAVTAYFDYAYEDSGNWGPISIVSQTATVMKFARTTSDGVWTLTQTISQVPSGPSVKLAMVLKNNTSVARTAYLIRYANIDADNFQFNYGDGTTNSAFIWIPMQNAATLPKSNGLALQNVGTPTFTQWGAFVQTTAFGPNPCAFANNWTYGPSYADFSAVLAAVGTVRAKGSRTLTVSYKGL